ncbi:sigma-70 family RNA polymerase sigma factor [Rathayibacter sp. AY1D4]|uniref:RNA polymerase sigma factor n=1 Tax=Rathayibacter sp. AY1D4 TaxID=2080545 RepID=UPI000CE874DE|nr:sigma-70 family RNA polymerase sigma factor [Rathayibacter sp. AY1D4]PPH70983.1 sigma-70 family RNA polymerase sigma factor [Rathayibacter sp. AY1D4]
MSAGEAAPSLARSVVRSPARDRGAEITALVEREAADLLRYFARRTASPEDAADLLSDTLLILWRKERSIPEDETRARMWAFGVARRVLSGQRRTATRRSALVERLAEELRITPPAPADDAAEDVRAAIAQLKPVDQEIITLVYWDGFSLAEAAEILSLRAATVRSRHARARATLREALGAAM